MSKSTLISPILDHAIESFDHSFDHFLGDQPRDRKFTVLHLDHSIELLLKEKISRLGKDLYKSNGQTLNFHECLKSLKEIDLPEKTRLQDIHDTRNMIQHKGLSIDESTVRFYFTEGYMFIKRFLRNELSVDIRDVLSPDKIWIFEGSNTFKTKHVLDLLEGEANDISIILNTYAALESYIKENGLSDKGLRNGLRTITHIRPGKSPQKAKKDIDNVFKYRNMILHQNVSLTEDQVNEYKESVKNIIELIETQK